MPVPVPSGSDDYDVILIGSVSVCAVGLLMAFGLMTKIVRKGGFDSKEPKKREAKGGKPSGYLRSHTLDKSGMRDPLLPPSDCLV